MVRTIAEKKAVYRSNVYVCYFPAIGLHHFYTEAWYYFFFPGSRWVSLFSLQQLEVYCNITYKSTTLYAYCTTLYAYWVDSKTLL